MLEYQGFVKEEVITEECRNGGKNVLKWKRVVEVLRRQIEIGLRKGTGEFEWTTKTGCVIRLLQDS